MSNPANSRGPSPSQPLVLLIFTFFFIVPPWYFPSNRYHGKSSNVEGAGRSFGSPSAWLPVLLMLLIVAIYISWTVEQSSSSSGRAAGIADGSSIHRIGGSAWGIGALVVMLMLICWCQSMMQE